MARALLADAGRDGDQEEVLRIVPDIYETPLAERPADFDGLPLVVKTHATRLASHRPVVSLHRAPSDALVSYWRLAKAERYYGWTDDVDSFAVANLPRWVQTASSELVRARSVRTTRIILYPDLCEDAARNLSAALGTWGLPVPRSVVESAVEMEPAANLEHGYSINILSKSVARRIERSTRSLWRELVHHAGVSALSRGAKSSS